jgi:hypothetical protein
MKTQKSLKKEGLFSMADRFVADFFDRLKKGAADQVIKKAENAKLPAEVVNRMKRMEKEAEEFKKLLDSL